MDQTNGEAFAQAIAAVEALWREEIAASDRTGAEAQTRVREAEGQVAELQAEIAEAELGIETAASAMIAMPPRLTQAQLEGDAGEEMALQGKYAELRSLVEGLHERARAAHQALSVLTGGKDPDAYLAERRAEAKPEVEAARYEAICIARAQFEELREVLEDRRTAVAGERTSQERLGHETALAAGDRPEAQPPHVRRAERAEGRRRFEENRRAVEASRRREREAAQEDQRLRAEKLGLPADRLVR